MSWQTSGVAKAAPLSSRHANIAWGIVALDTLSGGVTGKFPIMTDATLYVSTRLSRLWVFCPISDRKRSGRVRRQDLKNLKDLVDD